MNSERAHVGEIAKGGGAALSGLFASAVAQYAFNIGLARLFGSVAFGLFTFAFGIAMVAATLGQAGFRETLVRFVSAYQAEQELGRLRGIILFGVATGILGASCLALLASLLAPAIALASGKPDVVTGLRALAWGVPPIAIAALMSAALQGARRVGQASIVREVGRPIAGLVAVGASAYWGLPFGAFIAVFAACLTGPVALGAVWVWRGIWKPGGVARPEFASMDWLAFSLPITTLDVFRAGAAWVDPLLLGFIASASAVGIYYSALRTALLPAIMLAAFNAILTPLAAALWAQGDIAGLGRVFRTTTRWTWAASLPVAVVLVVLRHPIMGLFGAEFASDGAPVLAILAAGQLVNAMTGGVGQLLLMTGHGRLELLNTVVSVVLLTVGMIMVVPRNGIIGAALVSSGVMGLMNIVKLLEVRVAVGVHPYDRTFLKLLVAAIVASIAGVATAQIATRCTAVVQVALVIVAVGASYLGTMLTLRLDRDDTAIIRGLLSR